MTSRSHLGWPVPQSVWERHLEHVHSEWGSLDLYAGVETERIVKLWDRIETTDAVDLSRPAGDPPHTNEKKEQEPDTETRLEDQEKEYVQVRFNDDVADTVRARANQYDVNNGVMLAYMIREYYDTDGWGYSIETIGSGDTSDQDDEEEVPYGELEKAAWIADRLRERMDADGREQIHVEEIREAVDRAGAASRFDHYRNAALDELGYVHHPEINGVYISHRDLWADHGVGIDDPAIYRKPYDALTREEKIEGIKAILSTRGVAMPVSRIHQEVFDGNGSTQHIRDLVHTVAESEGATYQPTAGGTKVLRVAPCDYPSEPEQRSEPEPESEPESSEASESDGREEIESEAAAEMDALMQGTPKSDGGVATTDGGTDVW